MSNLDKKTLISIYSGIMLQGYMRNEPNQVWQHTEKAADSCINVAEVMVERLEQKFAEIDNNEG